MSSVTSDQDETQITTPFFSFRGKGKQTAELITILALLVTGLIGWMVWEHKDETKKGSQELQATFAAGFKEMTSAQKEQNSILRVQVCLLSLPPEKREREFGNEGSLCNRLARERM